MIGFPVRRVMARATAMAAIVGTAIVLINHGDHLWRGAALGPHFLLKASLSYVTPFTVSVVSSALSARDAAVARRPDR